MSLRQIKAIEATQNDGRGVSCVRTVITLLERGDLEGARAAIFVVVERV